MDNKPICVIYLKNPTMEACAKTINSQEVIQLKNDGYHVLLLKNEEKSDVKVFYQKDGVELDKQQLERLLSLCI